MKADSTLHRPIIQAGATLRIPASGRYFSVVEAPGLLGVKLDQAPESLLEQGQQLNADPEDQFSGVELRNLSDAPIRVAVWIGFTQFVDNRRSAMEAPTRFAPWTGDSLAAATGQRFPAAPAANNRDVRRKAIVVTNEDPALSIQVRDYAGAVGHTIFAQTAVSLPISGDVEIYNANGAAVACRIAEIWWTQ